MASLCIRPTRHLRLPVPVPPIRRINRDFDSWKERDSAAAATATAHPAASATARPRLSACASPDHLSSSIQALGPRARAPPPAAPRPRCRSRKHRRPDPQLPAPSAMLAVRPSRCRASFFPHHRASSPCLQAAAPSRYRENGPKWQWPTMVRLASCTEPHRAGEKSRAELCFIARRGATIGSGTDELSKPPRTHRPLVKVCSFFHKKETLGCPLAAPVGSLSGSSAKPH